MSLKKRKLSINGRTTVIMVCPVESPHRLTWVKMKKRFTTVVYCYETQVVLECYNVLKKPKYLYAFSLCG